MLGPGGQDAGSRLAGHSMPRGETVKQGYRLIVLDRDGVLVSEFQLTEQDLAEPVAFVSALREAIEQVEEQEP